MIKLKEFIICDESEQSFASIVFSRGKNLYYRSFEDIEFDPDVIGKAVKLHELQQVVIEDLMEPFETPKQLYQLVKGIRNYSNSYIMIYTSYKRSDMEGKHNHNREVYWKKIMAFSNIKMNYSDCIEFSNDK